MVSPHIDPLFDKFFDAVKLFYWYVPLHPYRRFTGPVSRKLYYLGVFCYYLVLISQLLEIFLYAMFILESLATDGDFLVTAGTAVWFILNFSAFQAMYFSWNSGPKLAKLINRLHENFPKTTQEKHPINAEEWAEEWSAKMRLQAIVFVVAVNGMCFTPLILSLVGYLLNDGVWISQLPLTLWLPFNPLQMPQFPFIYTIEIWLFMVNTVILVALEAVMGAVTMLICLQFKAVAEKFRSIQFGNYQRDLSVVRRTMKCHNIILDISTEAKKLFSFSLFVVFLFASMVFCIFMFLILNEQRLFIKGQYTANLICFFVFCAVFAYYGNVMIDHVSFLW